MNGGYMKKLVKLCLAFLLAFSVTSMVHSTQAVQIEAKTFQDFNYEENRQGIRITNYAGNSKIVNIPSEIDGKPVVEIGRTAFGECRGIEEIVLPQTIEVIDDYAFSKSTDLKKISIPDSVKSIGKYIFKDCISLTNVTLPSSMRSLSEGMFSGCRELETLTLPTNLTSISSGAFKGCSSLNQLTLPNSIITIESDVFNGCIELKEIILPSSLKTLGDFAFSKCSSLVNVQFSDSITSIGQGAFQNCISLDNVVLPNQLKVIGSTTFSGCGTLKNITLPSNLEAIHASAFSACASLESIKFPDTLTTIGTTAFSACSKLEKIDLPESLISLGEGAFSYCSSLSSVTFPDKLKTLEAEVFRYCANLQHVVIPDSITEIKNYVFANCASLESVTMPVSISRDKIGAGIFFQSEQVLTNVAENSGAYSYCVNNGYRYQILKEFIQLSQKEMTVYKGKYKKLTLITKNGVVIDNAKIQWSSNNKAIADVNNGIISGISEGTAIINAEYNGMNVQCIVTVDETIIPIDEITITQNEMEGNVGGILHLSATINPQNTTEDSTITWTSDNEKIAVVNKRGSVILLAPGRVTISVKAGNVSAQCSITVKNPIQSVSISPAVSYSINLGDKFQFRAGANPIDTTDDVKLTWKSSNPTVAKVDEKGNITTFSEGDTTITVTSINGKSASCRLRVNKNNDIPITGVSLDKTSVEIKSGKTIKLQAIILPEDTTMDKTLRWTSDDESVATVENGVITAVNEGDTVITVTTSNGKTAQCNVRVYKVFYNDLKKLIEDAEKINRESYTKESYQAFANELLQAKAVCADMEATQIEINHAVQMLENAISQLMERADSTITELLIQTVEEYSLLEKEYTSEEFYSMKKAISFAETILSKPVEERSKKEVTEAIEQLTIAKERLDLISSKHILAKQIIDVQEMLDKQANNYTEQSVLNLLSAIEHGNTVLIDYNSSIVHVKQAIIEIEKAILSLELKEQEKASKDNLIFFVQAIKDTPKDLYTKTSYEAFALGLKQANVVIEDINAIQQEIDQVLKNLIMTYTNLIKQPNFKALDLELDLASDILKESDAYYEDSISQLKIVYQNALNVRHDENSSQKDIKQAEQKLRQVRMLAKKKK